MAHPPTRAEFERLKAEYERLHGLVESLREEMLTFAKDAKIQFQRIAEIQAILDEERWRHDREEAHPAKSRTTGDRPAVMLTVREPSRRRRRSVG